MSEGHEDNPGVIAIPPLIYLVFFLIGIALDYVWPVAVLPDGIQYAAGFVLIALSVVIIGCVLPQFWKAQTSFDSHKPTTALITGGLFRYSRNPAYLSLTLLYLGIGIVTDNVWTLGLVVPTLLIMHYGVICREERYLEGKFGEEYVQYKASVRRWL